MPSYSAIVERCPEAGLLVAHVPGFAGAHTQAAYMSELQDNLREVIALLLEEGEPTLSSELVGVVQVKVE
ncbi:MAG: type II toxin-antitoxin system HicB family antitoxin [Trueperaceae bacterium]